jgi:hypothetical protein
MLGKLLAPVVGGIELSEHIQWDDATVFRHAARKKAEQALKEMGCRAPSSAFLRQ